MPFLIGLAPRWWRGYAALGELSTLPLHVLIRDRDSSRGARKQKPTVYVDGCLKR